MALTLEHRQLIPQTRLDGGACPYRVGDRRHTQVCGAIKPLVGPARQRPNSKRHRDLVHPANVAEIVPKLLNGLIGTKFKVVSGYASSGPGMLAMERGEVDGTGTSWAIVKSQKQVWLAEKKVKVILQMLPERSADLPDVPALGEVGRTAEDKEILNLYASGGALGRYVIAAPGLPAEIAKALRDGLAATLEDPEFLADAAKANLDIEPAPHDKLEAVVTRTLQVSDTVRQRVRDLLKQ